jgi:single-strand DNA-binding protein
MFNKAQLIGFVGKEPEIKQANDKEFAIFSLATSENWFDTRTNTRKTITDWHRIIVFNEGLVKVIKQFVNKGSKILVEGTIKNRKWKDQNNQEHTTTEIHLNKFGSQLVLLGALSNTKNDNASEQTEPNSFLLTDDDMLF